MKLVQIRQYLNNKYPRVNPRIVLPSIRGDLDSLWSLHKPENERGQEEDLITDMYVTKPLGYLTLELEDPEMEQPNLLRTFSFTRGIDFEMGAVPNDLIMDLVEAKYGYKPVFLTKKGADDMNTQLGWQSQGMWRAGVLLFLVDQPRRIEIDRAIEYSESLANLVSAITLDDMWRLKSKLRAMSAQAMSGILPNLCARIFEDRMADYLRRKYNYQDVETRWKPSYLAGKELDIYAINTRVRGTNRITICECKLILGDRTITFEEVQAFKNTSIKVESSERTLGRSQFQFQAWFVASSNKIEEEARRLVDEKFKIKVATLPSNWLNLDNWSIVEVQNLFPSV